MKKLVVYLTTLLVVITSLALDVRGQEPVKSGLPERLPIGDIQSIRDWTITNSLWQTEISVRLMYQDSIDTNFWSGNFPWLRPIKFSSYEDYENFLQAEGMHLVIFYRGIASPGSECAIQSVVKFDYMGTPYRPLIINSRLGPIDQVTSNSFVGLVQEYPSVLVPVKNMEYYKLECGDTNDNWTLKYWSIWDHGISRTSWGDTNINASTNAFFLGSEFVLATNRIRFTIVAEGKTNVYTQHGDSIFSPTSLVIAKDSVKVHFPRGADLTVQSSVDQTNWTTIYSLPWSAGTKFTSFPISVDSTTEKKFYRASVR